jgi:hypothetical protein
MIVANDRPARTPLGSRLYVQAAVSLATGTLTFLASLLVDQPLAQTIMLSVFVGGVAMVLQVLAQFDRRVAATQDLVSESSETMRDLVTEQFSAVSEATELFGLANASALREEVKRLARSSLRVSRPVPPLTLDLARSQLERTARFLEQIGGGYEAVYDNGEDRDWLLALTHHVTTSIDATSRGSVGPDGAFVDEGLWQTELGQRYLEAQGRAIRNGVTIRRVFVLDQADLAADPAFRGIYKEQVRMGIEVRAVDLAKLRSAGSTFVSDFVLFDDVVSYESEHGPRRPGWGPMYVRTLLILDELRISQQRHRFEELWAVPDELSAA